MTEPLPAGMPREVTAGRILSHLYEIASLLQQLDDPDELLVKVLDLSLQILGADRGMVMLRDAETGEVVPAVVRGLEEATVEEATRHSHTAVREALAGRPTIALDVAGDPGLKDLRSASLFDIRSLVCVPLKLPQNRILGVLYVDSRRPGMAFKEEDLRFLNAFASQAALALESAELYRRLRKENRALVRQARERTHYGALLGHSHPMQRVYEQLDRAAASTAPTILLGETGTGKELAARALHRRSNRASKPFLPVNCAAFAETLLESEMFGHVKGAFTGADSDRKGLFELAHGGVLFLDEVTGMSTPMQAKLLRVLAEGGEFRPLGSRDQRRSDVRILAATNMDLDAQVREGNFREDLFYRLNVIRIVMPPLRDRAEDIPALVDHFVEKIIETGQLQAPQMTPAALRELTAHDWPGNVRELEHTVQRLVLFAKGRKVDVKLLRQALPARSGSRGPAAPGSAGFPSLEAVQARHVRRVLDGCAWNREEAARRLGIARATIYRKIKEYGLTPPDRARRRRSPGN